MFFIRKRDYMELTGRLERLERVTNAREKADADKLFALSNSISELQDGFSELKELVSELSSENEQSLKLEQDFLAGLNGIMTYGVENGRKE